MYRCLLSGVGSLLAFRWVPASFASCGTSGGLLIQLQQLSTADFEGETALPVCSHSAGVVHRVWCTGDGGNGAHARAHARDMCARAHARTRGTCMTHTCICHRRMGKQEKGKKKQERRQESTPLSRNKAKKTVLLPPHERSFSIVSLGAIAWRYTVVYLLEMASYTLSQVASLVGKKQKECAKWTNRMWESGSLEDLQRTGRPTVIDEADVESVKRALSSSLPGTSLKVVLKRLQDEGKINSNPHEDSYRRALLDSGWSHQKVNCVLPLNHKTMDKRWAFAVKYRDTGLGNKAIFTDSKYFPGGIPIPIPIPYSYSYTYSYSYFYRW